MPTLPFFSTGPEFQENPKQLFVWGESERAQQASEGTVHHDSGSLIGMWPWAGLTLVVGHQLLQGAEGVSWGDVEAPVVQGPDLIMFHCIPMLGVVVSYRQRVAPCIGQRETAQDKAEAPTPDKATPIKPLLEPSWQLGSGAQG